MLFIKEKVDAVEYVLRNFNFKILGKLIDFFTYSKQNIWITIQPYV